MKPMKKEKHLTYFFEGEDAEDQTGIIYESDEESNNIMYK